MTRTGVVVFIILSLLTLVPSSAFAQGNIEEIRQYFELRDTISLMNLEMKRAMPSDSKSSLLVEPDAESRLGNFLRFIESRIESFSQSNTPLKYHYVKKLSALFSESKQLYTTLAPKLRAAGQLAAAAAAPAKNTAVTVVAIPDETSSVESLRVRPRPYFDSIGMRTLAPATATVGADDLPVQQPINRTPGYEQRPDLVKTPVVNPSQAGNSAAAVMQKPQPAREVKTAGIVSKTPAVPAARSPMVVAKAVDVKPVKPAKPVKALEPVKPIAPAAATEAVKLVEPVPVAAPVSKVEVVKPMEPITPGKPGETARPVEIVKPMDEIKPVTKPVTPVKPDKSGKPGKPEKPEEVVVKPAPVVPAGTGVMRPLAIMIENHNQSRPQSGLDQADLVYEMPVEGGITRFMAVFTRLPGLLGPVRSCREYFVDRALEIDALYVHCGGSPMGYAYISKSKINSIDEIAHGTPFFRDKTRKAPHNLYSKGTGIYEYTSAKFGMRLATQPVMLQYGNRVSQGATEPAISAKIKYHGNYSLEVKYENGAYQRYMNNVLHVDRETQQALRASAVVIQTASMKTVDAAGRQEISFIGSGTAWILEKGQRTKVTWHKDSPKTLTSYKDAAGIEYLFPKDLQIWVQVVSPAHKVFFNGEEEKPATVAGQPAVATPTENIGKQG